METSTNDDEYLREKLKVFHQPLIGKLIPTDLLTLLGDVLSDKDASTIKNFTRQISFEAGTDRLLIVLVEKTEVPGRWRMLLNALRVKKYEYLLNLLEGTTDVQEIDRNMNLINRFRPILKEKMNPIAILPSLVHKDVLIVGDRENIESESKNQGLQAASEMLLDRIHRRKTDWYKLFLETLVENECEHLVQEIDPDFMKKRAILEEEAERRDRGELDSATMENYDSDYGEALSDMKGLNTDVKQGSAFDEMATEVKLVKQGSAFDEMATEVKLVKQGSAFDEMATEVKLVKQGSAFDEMATEVKLVKKGSAFDEMATEVKLVKQGSAFDEMATEVKLVKQGSAFDEMATEVKLVKHGSEVDEKVTEAAQVNQTLTTPIQTPTTTNLTLTMPSQTPITPTQTPITPTQTQITPREPTEHDELSGPVRSPPQMNTNVQPEPVTPISIVYERVATVESDLSLRNYQKELAQPGLDGHNSIVVAPTNSGKTHVAIRVMEHHLKSRPGKIIFLVPTAALATQQKERCQEVLKCSAKVMTGDSQLKDNYVSMSVHLRSNDIIVATPQMLVNSLLSDDVSFKDFSLIVFDECHRTYEDTPYNTVMRLYFDLKFSQEGARLPQILGLTASLGSGNAKCQDSADFWVKQIMTNMDTRKLVTVKENIDELNEIINSTDMEIVRTKERHNLEFGDLINSMMAIIEAKINHAYADFKRPPACRDDSRYTEWCSKLCKQVTGTRDDDLHRRLKIYADYLEVYHRALLIYRDARCSDALRYLKEEVDDMFFENTAVETDHEMHQLFEEKRVLMERYNDHDQENPKLHEVQARLCTLFRTDPDSRAIIYVKTIELANCMETWMNECPELQPLNARGFVGSHAKVGLGGNTRSENDQILKAFRDGTHKVVVGTSILEEGLDIPRCNLVILYDHVTNEIQRVQTRGRIRRDNSQFVLITSEQGPAAQKERVNEVREEMASVAIERVQKEVEKNPSGFLAKQRDNQRKEKLERDAAKLLEKQRLQNSPVYEVKCNHCRTFLFLSSDLRKIKDIHHTIVAAGLRDRIMYGPRRKPLYVDKDMEHGVAELCCKNCQTIIGSVNKYTSLYFPLPRIDQIVFSRADKFITGKKWKKVKDVFAIKPYCSIEDMRFIMELSPEDKKFYTL
ncbi:ATP-dependent RNA helicase DHX58-like [Ylistrum balloti]|uniref:ATP-dependent RNA helicase DHX58-like n=1 Tax=Ylistrum balloti TaxID=509963 RepID=UPI002905867B|nr:ATP-dependent RNA helicase DHX58-like [Ylistrum balloti]